MMKIMVGRGDLTFKVGPRPWWWHGIPYIHKMLPVCKGRATTFGPFSLQQTGA